MCILKCGRLFVYAFFSKNIGNAAIGNVLRLETIRMGTHTKLDIIISIARVAVAGSVYVHGRIGLAPASIAVTKSDVGYKLRV